MPSGQHPLGWLLTCRKELGVDKKRRKNELISYKNKKGQKKKERKNKK